MDADGAPALDYPKLLQAAEALRLADCNRLLAALQAILACVEPRCALCDHCLAAAQTSLSEKPQANWPQPHRW